MTLKDVLRSWKIMVPTSTATVAALLWVLGIEFPRPVLANEYYKEIRTLNVKQLETREEFLEDRLERLQKEKLDVEQKTWEVQSKGQPMPPFLPELKLKIDHDIQEMEKTLEDVHTKRIKLQE